MAVDLTSDIRVLVGVRDDQHCRQALEWTISEFSRRQDKTVCLLLTHVVTELRNSAGKLVRLSEADGPSVAVHICDRVLPFLEAMQDVSDEAGLPSTVHVIKNEDTGAAILEAASKLEATHMVLASSAGKGASQWHTINACSDETKLPPGATLFIIEDGKKLKSISSGQPPAPTTAGTAGYATPAQDFKQYTLEELQAAMDHFWPNNVCGEGSYGVVYKGWLDGQAVAIKQLKNPDAKAALDEIEREVEVQKRIDHPNAVRLLGYCTEDRALVYEFLSNGSLEDRMLCVGGTPPLMWPERCRIAMEVAAGLQHLHTRKPPIVHRDVKPANVLLDDNFTAKLGDVGLARLMGDLAPGHSHVVRKSVIVGTEHYVDPEYLCARRGYLGPKSDVYSFGIVLLQLLVGDVPNPRRIDAAVEREELEVLLDPRAGEWPPNLAMDLANLGLWCAEMDRRDRPDLTEEVIPALLEICEAAAEAVVEWEGKQEAVRERQRQEREQKERERARKEEEARKGKERQEAGEAARKEQGVGGGGAKGKAGEGKTDASDVGKDDGAAHAQGGCCVLL
ncbi:unnamed protein product [Closterium sp. Yama58-4]|nr:unnamed protein product [Closterium sp. Yama58-4]